MGRTQGAFEDYARRNRYVLSDGASVPLYHQLFRLLERYILERHLHSEDRFPSEQAIAAAFDVSRPTANRATRELLNRGWLHRERGRGTFVARGSHVELALLSDELSLADQFQHETRLTSRPIHCRAGAAPSELADVLNIPDGAAVVELRRLRSIDECPILVSDAFLRADCFPGLETEPLIDGSLFATLRERYSVPVSRCERWLEASEVLAQDVADLLRVPLLAPLLLVRGLAYASNDEPIALMRSYVREGISFQATARPHLEPSLRTAKTFPETVEYDEGGPQ